MDGNGRWAQKRLLNRIRGHEKGAETVRTIVRASREVGLSFLTLYAFSTENWQRPKSEVAALMTLLRKFLDSETPELVENNIRLNTIGQIERLPQPVLAALRQAMAATHDKDGMTLNLALSYGGRSEIVSMVKAIGHKIIAHTLSPEDVTADLVARHLYTGGMPDPDLLIRTSGEMRISNFLLWQIAYAELYVTETLWPDFNRDEFIQILKNYQSRERRYGKVGS
jgi:undecaprenyl diphosphate synthase